MSRKPPKPEALRVLEEAHRAADMWANEFWGWMADRNLRDIRFFDRLPVEKRRELLAILDEGMNNITREKLEKLGIHESKASCQVAGASGHNEC